MASFSPVNSFSTFNVTNLVKLASFYPHDIGIEEMNQLPFQMMLDKTEKTSRYGIAYKLFKLVRVLPDAIAGVVRIFSSMNFIKNKMRSKMALLHKRFVGVGEIAFLGADVAPALTFHC